MYKEKINAKWLEQGYIARLKELKDREAIQILSNDHPPVVMITQDEYHVLLASRRMLIPDETEPVPPVSSREEFLARGKAVREENDAILAQDTWSGSSLASADEKRVFLKMRVLTMLEKVGLAEKKDLSDWLPKAYEAGLLPKSVLVPERYYFGCCRNAEVARWDGKKFWYIRNKFGETFAEEINHPEDDNGYDLFLPVGEIEQPQPHEIVRLGSVILDRTILEERRAPFWQNLENSVPPGKGLSFLPEWFSKAYELGLLREKELVKGKYYYGDTAGGSARVALWDGTNFQYVMEDKTIGLMKLAAHEMQSPTYPWFFPLGQTQPFWNEMVKE